MAVTYISGAAANNSGSTVTVTAPASIVAGNLLLAFVFEGSSTNSGFSAPTGWTQIGAQTPASGSGGMQVYSKTATGSEPANYAFGGPGFLAATVLQYAGTSGTDASVTFHTGTATTTATSASATAVTAADGIVVAFGANNGNTFSTPTGLALRQSTSSLGNESCYAFDGSLTGTGASPTYSSTLSASDGYTAATVLLRPTATGTTLAGVTATAAASAPAGALTASSALAGPAATAAASAPAGAFTTGTTLAGPVATATATAPAGGVIGGVNVVGSTATATATAPAGGFVTWPLPTRQDQAVLAFDGVGTAVLRAVDGGALPLLADDFAGTALRSDLWYSVGAPTPTVSGGALVLQPSPDYGAVGSVAPYRLLGAACTIEALAVPAPGSIPAREDSLWLFLSVAADAYPSASFLGLEVFGSSLRAYWLDAGGSEIDLASVTYDPAAHRWWRIGATAAGLVTWATSPDGATWTPLATSMTTLPLAALYVSLCSGYWDGTAPTGNALVGSVAFTTGTAPTGRDARLAFDGSSFAQLVAVTGDAHVIT